MWAIVGAGSNLGARSAILDAAREHLDALGIRVERRSHTYETPAMVPEGHAPGPAFLNEAWRVRTSRSPQRLLEVLRAVEARFGRVRTRRWGDRTLDLDILWAERRVDRPGLQVPHPGLATRAFALAPLLDVEPRLRALAVGMRRRPKRVLHGHANPADELSERLEQSFRQPVPGHVVTTIRATRDALPNVIGDAGLRVCRVAVLESPTESNDSTWSVALVGTPA